MKNSVTSLELTQFEDELIELFEKGKLRCPLHLSGGNEEELIRLFDHIDKQDYVFSTHRNHYHYLLKGGSKHILLAEIKGSKGSINKGMGRSMNFSDPSLNFYTSAIVGGGCAIAVGVALGLKKKKSKAHVWCFLGDGAEDGGHFLEAARFGASRRLPLTFIIEDNNKSVDSSKKDRWHNHMPIQLSNIIRYNYERRYPHVGIGKHVTF